MKLELIIETLNAAQHKIALGSLSSLSLDSLLDGSDTLYNEACVSNSETIFKSQSCQAFQHEFTQLENCIQ